MNHIIQHTIRQLQEVQTGKPWIGSTYSRKLNEIDAALVFTRPLKNLHSVAEIISHLTLWRNECILKIKTGEGSKTDDCKENWLDNDELKAIGWDTLKFNYDNSLTQLIDVLKQKDDQFLSEKYYDTDFKGYYEYHFVINGMLHHDLYHLGQLGLIIKYLKEDHNDEQ
ncbi:DinB family protein [Kordia sp. YSTF-M3]|uniref:DinB family protein n=1 Tax=Kordia aestuariivivens TaxID=2759037 RepID=A0ABR7Q3W5_9FLAO|nr:DinB family protein [Kordia aestuariivivens]MBC8753143.1 DinB family protein [Kordia aestuariivivens]